MPSDLTTRLPGSFSLQKLLKYVPQLSSTKDPTLCLRCRQIKWQDIIQRIRHTKFGEKVSKLEFDLPPRDTSSVETLECQICGLFADVRGRRITSRNIQVVYIGRADRFCSPYVKRYHMCAPIVVFEDESARLIGTLGIFHARSNSDYCAPRLFHSSVIDFSILRGWLQSCKAHSTNTCSPDVFALDHVPGFRVLDCITAEVIEAPAGCSYVALSYVWGSGQQPLIAGDFPLTIQDAITVTLAMGFDYLCEYMSLVCAFSMRSQL
jgi:hypothetical protein